MNFIFIGTLRDSVCWRHQRSANAYVVTTDRTTDQRVCLIMPQRQQYSRPLQPQPPYRHRRALCSLYTFTYLCTQKFQRFVSIRISLPFDFCRFLFYSILFFIPCSVRFIHFKIKIEWQPENENERSTLSVLLLKNKHTHNKLVCAVYALASCSEGIRNQISNNSDDNNNNSGIGNFCA